MFLITVILILWCCITIYKTKSTTSPAGFTYANTLPLRGILAILITIHHACLSLTFGIPEDSLVNYLNELHEWGYLIVSVFFFISGYGLIKSYDIKGESYLKKFIKKRFSSIVIPFLVCIGIYTLITHLIFHSTINCSLEAWRGNCPLLPTSWYVVVIILFYAAFYVIARLLKKSSLVIWGLALFTLIYMVTMRAFEFREHWWCTIPCLSLGMIISHNESVISRIINKRYTITTIIILVIWCCLYLFDMPYRLNEHHSFPILGMFRSITIATIVYLFIHCTGFYKHEILNYLGRISYEIYLVQGMVTGYLYIYLGAHPIIYLLGSVFVSVILAYSFNRISQLKVILSRASNS